LTPRQQTRDTHAPTRLLIIEDEPLVAEALREGLVEAGFEVVGVANRLAKGLELIAANEFDAAIVDANLAGKSASPAIELLTSLGRPFLVLSGYTREQLSDPFTRAVFVKKPYRLEDLVAHLKALPRGGKS
jgi:DNA-binding response OmpR family regulator